MAEYAMERGIPREDIVLDYAADAPMTVVIAPGIFLASKSYPGYAGVSPAASVTSRMGIDVVGEVADRQYLMYGISRYRAREL